MLCLANFQALTLQDCKDSRCSNHSALSFQVGHGELREDAGCKNGILVTYAES